MVDFKLIILIIGLIASLVTVSSCIPLTFRLAMKKQTTGLSAAFSIFIIIAGIFWLIYAGLLYEQLKTAANITVAISASVPIIITNGMGIICHLINLMVKYQMINGAKKNNMTEKQFCDLFHQKQIQKKLAKSKK